MSRTLDYNNGNLIEEIESMDVCRWRINDVCCNDKSDYLADYPDPMEICYEDCKHHIRCKNYENNV